MSEYKKRIIDNILRETLEYSGAVLIEGPKWCGKTSTASKIAKSILDMHDPDYAESNIQMAITRPSELLKGDKPRLIDEWQVAPVLWDAVRISVDRENKEGLYILTGSSLPKDGKVMHSGAGRISRLTMRTMSLYESEDSNGEVSVKKLFEGGYDDISSTSKLTFDRLAYLVCRGGWPKSLFLSEKGSLAKTKDYIEAIVNKETFDYDGVKRDPKKIEPLLKSLARNIGTEASIKTIIGDISTFGGSLSDESARDYIDALKKIFVIEPLYAWNPKLRSKVAVRSTPRYHFTDQSIGTAALGINPNDLKKDINTYGFYFESMCIKDLRVYAQSNDGEVFYYRDSNGLECDAVIHLRNGKWGA
ncbi:DUF4143 domain-containing protein, partial [Acholeplasma sp. OttesenSCG-928-E16]|nr:DUF4143 domain-containing protein [Acholeplasma sp. OttesenSCG-928-E16]